MRKLNFTRFISITFVSLFLAACAHPIAITPIQTPERTQSSLKAKKVAYVMSDIERNKQVTTAGGGGDKVSYYPYKDSEKAIRDALRSVYEDVIVLKSDSDFELLKENGIDLVYTPTITTVSSSDSAFTWPPTYFRIELSCNVTDNKGGRITTIKIDGNGYAEFSEFKANFGLAGNRATSDLSTKLQKEILNNPSLY